MNEEGYYKKVNGEWVHAPNGIVLPYTDTPTLDKEIMEADGWVWLTEKPIEENEGE